MISPNFFIDSLREKGINFFAGVPDSLLKNICAYISDNLDERHNIITANEGAAIGVAAGHYLATDEIPCVYLQNSGEGNIINPLASLTDRDVYNIPVLLLIGWRGKPGVHDEPQHVKQGKVTLDLLKTMGIKYEVLSKDEVGFAKQLDNAVKYMEKTKESFAFVVEKDTFDAYSVQKTEINDYSMTRESAIQAVASSLQEKDVIISTTGMISRELFEYRAQKKESHDKDFLTVGSMGHSSQIALGVAMEKTDRRVWCFDGDGSVIMHMGSMAIISSKKPSNYVHVVFNNGAHDSVGGQPTVGNMINFQKIAKAVGYEKIYYASDIEDLDSVLMQIKNNENLSFLEIRVKKGNRKDLGRPTTKPIQNKEAFIAFLKK